MILRPAANLDEAWQTLSTLPLVDPEPFQAFYRGAVNAVRGGDPIALMAYGLRLSFGGAFYKTFLMGHPGVGKSTEMTRLSRDVAGQYRVLRFSAQTDRFDVQAVTYEEKAERPWLSTTTRRAMTCRTRRSTPCCALVPCRSSTASAGSGYIRSSSIT